MFRSLTKFCARPALRLGYALLGNIFPSAANPCSPGSWRFEPEARTFHRWLLAERVAARDCTWFHGLGTDHVRIAARRPDRQAVPLARRRRLMQ